MKKIEILTLASDEPKVIESVGDMGVLHLTASPVEAGAMPFAGKESRESEDHVEDLQERVKRICRSLDIDTSQSPRIVPHSSIQEIERDLSVIGPEVDAVVNEREKLAVTRDHAERLLRDTSVLHHIDAPVEQLDKMSFLHFAIGSITEESAQAAATELGERVALFPFKTPYGETKVIGISTKKGRWELDTTLEKHGFKKDVLPSDTKGLPAQVSQAAEQQLTETIDLQAKNDQKAREAAERHSERLLQIHRRLATEHAIMEARQKFARTWATMLINGWLPEDKVNALCDKVLDLTGGRAVIEVRDHAAGEEEPPTLMKNPWFMKPFEALISAYSLPNYAEIEPTPFFSILFVIMFGLMFGDIGHSGLLLIAGLIMWRRGRRTVHDFGVILTFCGIFGMICGAVEGSLFGYELHPFSVAGVQIRFIHPLQHAEGLLAMTVIFGIAVISLGVVLNIINGFRRREFLDTMFHRFGIVGGIFYWGTLVLAVRGLLHHQVSWLAISFIVIMPLLIIVFYHPMKALVAKKRGAHEDEGVGMLIVEGATESFETVLSYVANTLSFARIGAFALAHAGLSITIYELMDIVRGIPGGPVWVVLVFILGTSLIMLLEGFIVAIQSLRLEYYEFFNKFYRGEGRRYEPFDLKTRTPLA